MSSSARVTVRDMINFLLGACSLLGFYSFFVFNEIAGYKHMDLQFFTTSPQTTADAPQLLDCSKEKGENIRVVFFFGTRPEIIKLAPVIEAFKREPAFNVSTVFTGQHPDLVKPFELFWNVSADIHIGGIMSQGQSLSMLTSNLIAAIERRVPSCKSPSSSKEVWVVQGDTTSALAAGLVGFNRGISIAHIEAGLRTFDMRSPFPEEFNRKTLASLTSFHFTPTEGTKENLLKEGIDPSKIFVTGNTVIDAVRLAEKKIHPRALGAAVKPFQKGVGELELDSSSSLSSSDAALMLVLVTMHRRENQGIMGKIFSAIGAIKCPRCIYAIPVHPNPAATAAARMVCKKDARFHCIPPLDYASTQWMLNNSRLILTDSGGLQEESTWYGTPTIVLRDTTERPEAVRAGISKLLVGRNLTILTETLQELIAQPDSALFRTMSRKLLPFGDGHATARIEKVLLEQADALTSYAPLKIIENPLILLPDNKDKGPGNGGSMPQVTSSLLHLYPCRNENEAKWSSSCYLNGTVTIGLTVWKRTSLARQLDDAARQSVKPSQILVVQNENHWDAKSVIEEWKEKNPGIKVHFIHFSANSGYHGRFHVAYMLSKTEYISIWDDDVIAGPDWVKENILQSKAHNDALMGGNGRCILSLPEKSRKTSVAEQKPRVGQNDFVGHSWTLKRDHLRYFFAAPPLTYATGEDIQLAFALQLNGIPSYMTRQHGKATLKDDVEMRKDEFASYTRKDKNMIRTLLLCQVIRAGFRTLQCENCKQEVADECIRDFQSKVEKAGLGEDE